MTEFALLGKIYSYEKTAMTIDELKLAIKNIPDISDLKKIAKPNIQEEYDNLTNDLDLNLDEKIKIFFIENIYRLQYAIPSIKNKFLKNYFKTLVDFENIIILIKFYLLQNFKPRFLKNGWLPKKIYENLLAENDLKKALLELESFVENSVSHSILEQTIKSIYADTSGDYDKIILLAKLDLLEELRNSSDPLAKIFGFYKTKTTELFLEENLYLEN